MIPAYNEEKRLPPAIQDLRAFFGPPRLNAPNDLEVIIVIEKSKDATVERSKAAVLMPSGDPDPRFRIIANDVQRGKGYAVKTGMLAANGEIALFMDADLSTPLAEVLKFLALMSEDPSIDILIGSRAEAKSQILKKQSWIRRNMGRAFNHFVQLFGVRGIKDTQCGFKAFRQHTVAAIFERQTLDGFAFDVELLVLAEKLGYKIKAEPVRWVNSPDSKVRIWIDPLKMLWDLIRIRWIVTRSMLHHPKD